MDDLVGLLDGPRARGAFLLRSMMSPPWSLRIEDEAPLTVIALVRGEAWLVRDGADAVRMGPGDLAVVCGPGHYTVADDPATRPQVVVHPGQHCTTLSGEDLQPAMDLGVRTWGNDPAGSTTMLTGTYQLTGEISRRLLATLPVLLVLAADSWRCPLIPVLTEEIVRDEPGQQAVLDRLLDLLLVAAIREWFSQSRSRPPAGYAGYADPVVGRALRLLQNDPAQPWTVASLAAAVGISRAALARRFTALVGEPPMSHLADRRLALAADLLCEPGSTLRAVAREVGYGSPYALSSAFKRVRGVSPDRYRAESSAGRAAGRV
jgi:AraC-like DNA-binding protein